MVMADVSARGVFRVSGVIRARPKLSTVVLRLASLGLPRDVVLDGHSLGPNVHKATIEVVTQEFSKLIVEIYVDTVETEHVADDFKQAEHG